MSLFAEYSQVPWRHPLWMQGICPVFVHIPVWNRQVLSVPMKFVYISWIYCERRKLYRVWKWEREVFQKEQKRLPYVSMQSHNDLLWIKGKKNFHKFSLVDDSESSSHYYKSLLAKLETFWFSVLWKSVGFKRGVQIEWLERVDKYWNG